MDLFIKNNFKKDKSGKSDAYFLKKKIKFNQIFFKKFLKFAKRDKKNIRICCHKNINSKLHNMINIMFKINNEAIPHKHIYKDEVYHILYGEIEVVIFNKKKEKIILNNKNKLIRIEKNTFHLVRSRTNVSIFHEIRQGPFLKNDSIFLNKRVNGI